jgi:hypothetical protein
MSFTVLLVLAFLALLCAIASALGKCPLWVAVVVLALYALVQQLPVGHQ